MIDTHTVQTYLDIDLLKVLVGVLRGLDHGAEALQVTGTFDFSTVAPW